MSSQIMCYEADVVALLAQLGTSRARNAHGMGLVRTVLSHYLQMYVGRRLYVSLELQNELGDWGINGETNLI